MLIWSEYAQLYENEQKETKNSIVYTTNRDSGNEKRETKLGSGDSDKSFLNGHFGRGGGLGASVSGLRAASKTAPSKTAHFTLQDQP